MAPEVIAEGLKVISAAGVTLDTVDYDLGGNATAATARFCPTVLSKNGAASMPFTSEQ